MSRYKQLLSNVPQERQNVPVVLHAMLEQVSSQSEQQRMCCCAFHVQPLRVSAASRILQAHCCEVIHVWCATGWLYAAVAASNQELIDARIQPVSDE
jgi:hypothetical protein